MPGEMIAIAPWPCAKMVATSKSRPVGVTNTYIMRFDLLTSLALSCLHSRKELFESQNHASVSHYIKILESG
jgi:hypothetical protein